MPVTDNPPDDEERTELRYVTPGTPMIKYSLVMEAAGLTSAVVLLAAGLAHWPPKAAFGATLGTFGLLVLWRAIANGESLNEDFVAYVSVGDCGCLLAGALAPIAVAAAGVPGGRRALPVLAGGIAGFLINVVIL
jgi:hypothetical protein